MCEGFVYYVCMMRFFRQLPGVYVSLSGAKDGAFSSFYSLKRDARARKKTETYLKRQEISPQSVVAGELVFGSRVATVKTASTGKRVHVVRGVDALVTNQQEVFLAVTGADCFPVFFADHKAKVVGVAHASWRGIVGGIIINTLRTMRQRGANYEDIHVSIGPGICPRHFEIQEDVLSYFLAWESHIVRRRKKIFVDLPGIMTEQLLGAGIGTRHITQRRICTYTGRKLLFSARRYAHEGGRDGRMIALIGLR